MASSVVEVLVEGGLPPSATSLEVGVAMGEEVMVTVMVEVKMKTKKKKKLEGIKERVGLQVGSEGLFPSALIMSSIDP